MSTLPCLFCDGPIPESEAERASLCPLCSRPLTVCGRYRLKSLLSKSESDRVYAATDGDKDVAVKVWLARDDDWSTISEFERIARTLQASKNRNHPQIFGWEKGGQGRLILVREQLHGSTLEERLRIGQRPPAPRKVLEDLLGALADLHRLSPPLLHRDIRAAHVLFRSKDDWSPVLVDFDPRSAGNATTTTDLSALARMMQLAGASGGVVDRMANGGFHSADLALAELRADTSSAKKPAARPAAAARPGAVRDSEAQRKRLVPILVGIFVMAGFVSGLLNSNKRRVKQAQRTSSSDRGDSAVEGFRNKCDRGDALGCYNLGYRYEKGKGITKSESRAASLYQQSCDMGEKLACNNLAVLFETGRGVVKDASQAARLYTRACDQKDWLACRNLGFLYSNGVGVAADVPRAMKLYQQSCDHGEAKGCYNLGVLYETGKGVTADFAKARALYQRACDASDWEGCTNLGWIYAQGMGVPVDQDKAREMYEKSCANEDARACNNLGVVYEKGRNVPIDLVQAFKLYLRACDGDDYFGCCNLGYFYETGKGTEKDLNKATQLYLKSCKLGYDKGCQYLLDMAKDSRTGRYAKGLMQDACDGGHGWSCDHLK
jgi:TPR repeat protein